MRRCGRGRDGKGVLYDAGAGRRGPDDHHHADEEHAQGREDSERALIRAKDRPKQFKREADAQLVGFQRVVRVLHKGAALLPEKLFQKGVHKITPCI